MSRFVSMQESDMQQPATVLFIIPWSLSAIGGVNQVVLNLAREMTRSGRCRSMVLVTDWSATRPVLSIDQGITVVRWRVRPPALSGTLRDRVLFALWFCWFRIRFQRFCQANRITAVNIHYPGPSAFTFVRFGDVSNWPFRLALTFHGADVTAIETAPQETRAEWAKLTANPKVTAIACSRSLCQRLRTLFDAALNLNVVHNGLDSARFVAQASGESRNRDQNILCVGKFEQKKGQDILIQAFALLASTYKDLRLTLIGAADRQLATLRLLARSQRVESRVTFAVDIPHHEIAAHYRDATLFVLPSRREPFGIVLLEAGAFALPVVASEVDGIPEVITDKLTGRLVPPDDPNALALCIKSVLDDPVTAETMGQRLKARVLSDFSWSRAAQSYNRILFE